MRRRIKGLLQISEGCFPFSYLGVPMFVGSPRRSHLQPIVDKIIAKFTNWIGHSISMAGRICLINSVITSSLVYSMMVYKWPTALLKKLEAAMRNFSWSGDITKKGAVMVSWSRCCYPINEGGLNLRSIQSMNEAFLMRLAWDIHCNKAPFSDMFKLRFYNRFRHPKTNYLKSTIWSGLRSHMLNFDKSALFLIGNNSNARFWLDNWLGYTIADRLAIPNHVKERLNHTISQYYFDDSWHFTLSFCIDYWDILTDILSYPLGPANSDTIIWPPSALGTITAKTAYSRLERKIRQLAGVLGFGARLFLRGNRSPLGGQLMTNYQPGINYTVKDLRYVLYVLNLMKMWIIYSYSVSLLSLFGKR